MTTTLVDSSVLIDIFTEDRTWYGWSSSALEECAESSELAINPIIFAEASVRFSTVEELDGSLPSHVFRRLPLPWEAAFLAGRCFLAYRQRGGVRASPLPDFYIGAHAAVVGMKLLTRDASRFRTYFPTLEIISP